MRAGGVRVEVGTGAEETMFGGSTSTRMAGVDGGAIMALQRWSASRAAVGVAV
jgi:hypothetical protein